MIRFGDSVVNVDARIVERGGIEQHLEPQAFDVLVYLLSNSERVVPKSEILDAVWGDQFVSESALTTRIKEVRQAVGDDGVRQEFVKNFRGRGYRFVAPLESEIEPTGELRRFGNRSTQLVGRDDDIANIIELLSDSALVTLVGPGGVGKTSLAVEVAQQVSQRCTDGFRLVQLAPVRDAQSMIHALRRDTDLFDVGDDEADVIEAIAALDGVVVLDNCEHVVGEAARLAQAILLADGDVTVLATSRERLAVPGEQIWPVAPLADGPARELLLRRSQAVDPDFGWSDGDDDEVARLLAAVDHLPLAIEMAAARLPTIGVADLAALLDERLDLLRSSDRTANDRHRTVGALTAWSEDLLDDVERDLLAALTVFAGPVAADDIAPIVGIDAAELVVGPLANLVDRSLVVADAAVQPTGYRLLETVRASAAPRRVAETDERHARHLAAVVAAADRQLRTADEPQAVARIDDLVAEIRVAHAWAREHAPAVAGELTASLLLFSFNQQWTEPSTWALELCELIDQQQYSEAALAASASIAADAANRGDYDKAARCALPAASSTDARVAALALDTLSNIGLYTGDLEAATVHAESLLELATRTGDSSVQVMGALGLVLGSLYSGRVDDAEAALELFDSGLAYCPSSLAWMSYGTGEVLSVLGRPEDALREFERASELASSVGSRLVLSVAQVSALAVRARSGDVAEAIAAFAPVLNQYRRTRSLTHAITALRNLIELLVRAGEPHSAMVLYGTLSNPSVKSTYGSEFELLEDARSIASERLGAEPAASAIVEGARHDVLWAVDFAIDVLDDLV